jgi:hypothetical protein
MAQPDTSAFGTLAAKVDNSGKTPVLHITGQFKNNGQKPRYELQEADSPGINPTILLMTVTFADTIVANGSGTTPELRYSKTLGSETQYESVEVRDDDRLLAQAKVAR